MACTVTPKQVNEDVKGRLEKAYPGLQITTTLDSGYTYNMYDYVDSLSDTDAVKLSTSKSVEGTSLGEILTEEAKNNVNTLFDHEVITVEDTTSSIKADDIIAARLTTQNQQDEHAVKRIEQEGQAAFDDFYFNTPSIIGRVHKFFTNKSSKERRIRVYKTLSAGNTKADLGFVLDRISKGSHPLNKLAGHLLDGALESGVGVQFVNMEDIPNGTRTDNGQTFAAAGQYNPSTNIIMVGIDSSADPEAIILHEAIHALTYLKIERNKTSTEVQEFMKIYDKVKGAPGIAGSYAVSNLHEFITHIFTDPGFMRALSRIPSDKPARTGGVMSVLENIFHSVYRILGITSKDNMLNQALYAAEEIFKLPLYPNNNLGEIIPEEYYRALEDTIPLYAAEKKKSKIQSLTDFLKNLKGDHKASNVKPLDVTRDIVKKDVAIVSEWAPKGLKAKLAAGAITKEFYFKVINSLTMMRNAHVEIQLVNTPRKDGTVESQYYNHQDGSFYRRVSNVVHDEDMKENYWLKVSSKHGNKFDEFVRNFFNGGITEEQKAKDYFGEESYYTDFYMSLLSFSQELADRGEEVVPGEILLHDPITKVAGTVDLMTVDADGNFRIYDLKTMRGVGTNFEVDNDGYSKYDRPYKYINGKPNKDVHKDSKRIQHQKQLSLYSYILERTYDFRASDLTIIPVEIDYARPTSDEEVENSKVTNAVIRERIPFKRLPSIKNIIQPKQGEETKNVGAPLDNSTTALIRYLHNSLEELNQRIREYNSLIRNTKDPKIKAEYSYKRNQVQAVHDETLKSYFKLRKEGERNFFNSITQEVTQLQSFLQNGLMDPYLEDRLFFLHHFILGVAHPKDANTSILPVNISALSGYDVPEYQALTTSFNNLLKSYFGVGTGATRIPGYLDTKMSEIVSNDILIANNLLANPKAILNVALGYTDEDIAKLSKQELQALAEEHADTALKKIQEAPEDVKQGWFSTNLLSTGYSMVEDSVLPQVMKSAYNTAIEVAQSRFKSSIDAITQVQHQLKEAGITDMSFMFEKTKGGAVTNTLASAINSRWLQENITIPVRKTLMNTVFTPKQKAEYIYNTIKNNAEAIDPRKLSAVQSEYSISHGYMFTEEDKAATQAYEDRLKYILGPGYDAVVQEALDNFSQAVSQIEHIGVYNKDFHSMQSKIQVDPTMAIDLLNKPIDPADVDGFEYGIRIPDTKGLAYPNYKYVTFIPKLTKESERGDGYNSEFIESFQNDANGDLKAAAWKAFNEAYSKVSFTYRNYDVTPNTISKNYKTVEEMVSTDKLNKVAASIGPKSSTNKFLKAATVLANDLKKHAFTSQKGDPSVKKEIRSNYADVYNSYRKSLIQTLKFHSVADLAKAYTDLTGKQSVRLSRAHLLTEISYELTNMVFSEDIFTSTKEALRSAIQQEARQETLPKANLIVEMYKNLSNKMVGEANETTLDTRNPRAVQKLQDFVDRQIYGIGEIELDLDGNVKKKKTIANTVKKGTKVVTFFDDLRKNPQTARGKKMGEIYTLAVERGFLPSKLLAFMSDREKVLFQHLDDLLQKGLGEDATVSFTVNGIKYRRVGEIQKGGNGSVKYVDYMENDLGKTTQISEKDMDEAFTNYIISKMDDLGLSITWSGMADGFLALTRFASLGFSVMGGTFNRIDGKISNYILNASGKVWDDPQVNNKTANFLFGYNVWRSTNANIVSLVDSDRGKQYGVLTYLLENANILQSTANGDEGSNRHNMSTQQSLKKTLLGTYSFAVDLPEGKNQVTPMLNILQSTYITRNDGVQVPLFDGNNFPAWDLVDGVIQLKPEFRTNEEGNINQSNINNWENFEPNIEDLQDNAYTLLRRRVVEAIETGQGDYSQYNNIMATKHIAGRLLSLLFKWAYMQHRLWWAQGGGFNIVTGKTETAGFAKSLMKTPLVGAGALAAFLGVQTGVSLATALSGGGFLIAGMVVYAIFRKNKKMSETIDTDLRKNLRLTANLGSEILLEYINIPLHMAYSKGRVQDIFSRTKNGELRKPLSAFTKSNEEMYGKDATEAIKAVAANLAIVIHATTFPLILQLLTGLWVDDDEPDSFGRMLHNFLNNSTDRIASSSTMMVSPLAIAKQLQELYVLSLADDISTGLKSPDLSTGAAAITKKFLPKPGKAAVDMMLPSRPERFNGLDTYTPFGLILDDEEYTKGTWVDNLVRDMATDGEYSAKKERLKIMKELKGDIYREHRGMWDWFWNSETAEEDIDKLIKEIPKKRRGKKAQTESEALLDIQMFRDAREAEE